MSRKYNSQMAQSVYNNFLEMFTKEGNCYHTLKQSIDNEYEHRKIPEGASKMMLEGILRDVTVDYFKNHIKAIPEEQYFK
jgi:hypothetical protein